MLKYNSKYAQLIAKQKTNLDEITQVVQAFPHFELIDSIRRDIHELHEKQLSFVNHFYEFDGMIGKLHEEHGLTMVDGMMNPPSPNSSLIND